jgi:hypothetical protein
VETLVSVLTRRTGLDQGDRALAGWFQIRNAWAVSACAVSVTSRHEPSRHEPSREASGAPHRSRDLIRSCSCILAAARSHQIVLLHSAAYCRARGDNGRPFLSATPMPSSSAIDWPSSTFLASNLAMMHSQLDFEAFRAMQTAMKLRCASRGYSYLLPGFGFGRGSTLLLFKCGTYAWTAGLVGTGFCACAVVVCGACVEPLL